MRGLFGQIVTGHLMPLLPPLEHAKRPAFGLWACLDGGSGWCFHPWGDPSKHGTPRTV